MIQKLKRRFADGRNNKDILEKEYKNIEVKEEFEGNISLLEMKKVKQNWYVDEEKRCIFAKDYQWLEIYPKDKNYCITAIYDENREIKEWYIDIAQKIEIENNIPYEDDLYLDVVFVPDGRIHLLDEDELKDAYNKNKISKEQYDMAYEVAKDIIKNIKNRKEELTNFCDKYLKKLNNKSEM
jgi:hypothetical protein